MATNMLNKPDLRQGLVKMFNALKGAEDARNGNPSAARKKAFFGYLVEEMESEHPEIDFVTPFNCYPKKRGQMPRSLISWYRFLRRNEEIETICRAGQSAMVTAQSGFSPPISSLDVEYIQEAFKKRAELDGEAMRRVLLPNKPVEFSPKEHHIFLFDTLQRYVPKWGSKRICAFANKACLCRSKRHDDRMLRKQRGKWRKAIEDAEYFRTKPPEFVRRFMEHEERGRHESEALTAARIRNPKIRAATSDKKEFLREKKRGWKLEEKVMIGNGAIWLLSPPDWMTHAEQVSDRESSI